MATGSATFLRWVERIEAGTFTKNDCKWWANVIVPRSQDAQTVATPLTVLEAGTLVVLMRQKVGMKLTRAHRLELREKFHQSATPEGRVLDLEDIIVNCEDFIYCGGSSDRQPSFVLVGQHSVYDFRFEANDQPDAQESYVLHWKRIGARSEYDKVVHLHRKR